MAVLELEEARAQALELAATVKLPVTARSLTAAEIARIDGRYVPIILCIFLVFALPLFLLFLFAGGEGPGSVALLAGAVALLGSVLWLFASRRARARGFYVDPQIVVEIGAERMILRAPGRIEELAYAGVKARIHHVRIRRSAYFLGLTLESPQFGPLRLEDLWFKPGRTAAAALAGRLEASGVLGREDGFDGT
jgi:hypothetical protein